MGDLRQQVIEALCSVRVPVEGDGLLYADANGTMPIYSDDERDANLLADAVVAALAGPRQDVIVATYHDVGVNFGDHGETMVKVVTVGEDETVRGLMDRLFPGHITEPWSGMSRINPRRHDNYLVLRFAEPTPTLEPGPDGLGF